MIKTQPTLWIALLFAFLALFVALTKLCLSSCFLIQLLLFVCAVMVEILLI
jgi:hypothetical protein